MLGVRERESGLFPWAMSSHAWSAAAMARSLLHNPQAHVANVEAVAGARSLAPA